MGLFDFIQWCFRSNEAAVVTVFVAWLAVDGLAKIARALRGGGE